MRLSLDLARRAGLAQDLKARFLNEDHGAVTVDWVVLTAGLVGLGLATLAVVSGGVENLSEETAQDIADTPIRTRFAGITQLFSGDFSNGSSGFSGGTVVNAPGFGEVLQIGQGETVEQSFDIPIGAGEATFDFDLIAADDFDGDTATIYVNGEAVSFYTDDNGTVTVTDGGVSGVSVSVNQQYTNANTGGGSQDDSRASYSITVSDPGSTVTLGVSSNATAGASNEYFAIDDVSVSYD